MKAPAISASILEGRRSSGFALGLLLIAVLLIWLGVASPLIGWYRGRTLALAERQSVVQHMAALAANLPALRAEALHAQTAVPQAMLIKGDSDAMAAAFLQSRIEELAQRVDAPLASVGIVPGEPAGRWRRIGLRIAVRAEYGVVVGLLQSLLNTTPAMSIDDLSLRAALLSVPGRPMTMDAEFTVYAFRRAAPASRPAPEHQASAR
ncbi:MAG: type II secretion system protein GspM [Acetobacteraceae bacterium]